MVVKPISNLYLFTTHSASLVKKVYNEVSALVAKNLLTIWILGDGVQNVKLQMDKRTQMQEEAITS